MKPATDLNDLAAFSSVARWRSFRKAAQERGVSASALSHTVRSLEERLGVRLLNRTTRSVAPTEAGAMLLAQVAPALSALGEALDVVNRWRDTPAGTLKLSVPRSVARLLLAPHLARFSADHPQIRLELVTDDGLVDIVAAGFDAGVRFGQTLGKDMVAIPMGPPVAMAVVAAPGYLARHGVPAHPSGLMAHDCIIRRFPSGVRYAWEFARNDEYLEVDVEGPLALDDDHIILQAVLDGAGIAYTFEAFAREHLQAGRLEPVLAEWWLPPERLYLYYPSQRRVPAPLRAFIEATRTWGAQV